MPLSPWADGDTAPVAKTKLNAIITDLEAHEASTSNPHEVTAAQAGAVPLVDPATAGHLVQLTADGALEDAGVAGDEVLTAGDADFTLAGDEGTPQTITGGDVLSLLGHGLLLTTALDTDTVRARARLEAYLGPPDGGTPDEGELRLDAAGALWLYDADAELQYGETGWRQLTCGKCGDAPLAGDFAGAALLDGYYWRETATGIVWRWDAGWSRWVSYGDPLPVNPLDGALGSDEFLFKSAAGYDAYDLLLDHVTLWCATVPGDYAVDASHYYTIDLTAEDSPYDETCDRQVLVSVTHDTAAEAWHDAIPAPGDGLLDSSSGRRFLGGRLVKVNPYAGDHLDPLRWRVTLWLRLVRP